MMIGSSAESGGVIVCATVQEISEPRTLLDLMRERMDGGDARRAKWKGIKERLRLRGMGFCGALWALANQNDVVLEQQNAPQMDRPVTSDQHAPAQDDVVEPQSLPQIDAPATSEQHAPVRDNFIESQAVTNLNVTVSSEPHAPSDIVEHRPTAQNDIILVEAVTFTGDTHARVERVETNSECTSRAAPIMPSINLATALAAEREFSTMLESPQARGGGEGRVGACAESEVVKVTLMRLLTMDGGDEEREKRGAGVDGVCCVCMVRKKGAAYIPCGHTFCRVCCREVWLIRGTCPLCSCSILDILNIF